MASLVFWLALFWLAVHGAKLWFKRTKPLLPLTQGRRPVVEVEVKHLHLRVKTHVLNGLHDRLCKDLASEQCRLPRRILLKFYDLGSVMAAIGMATTLILLWWTTVDLFMSVARTPSNGPPDTLTRRGLEYNSGKVSTLAENGGFTVTPIVSLISSPPGLVHGPENLRYLE